MESLPWRQVENLLRFLRTIHAAQTPDDLNRAFIESIERLVPCEVVGVNPVDFRQGKTRMISNVEFPAARLARFYALIGQHPLGSHTTRTAGSRGLRLSDLVPPREFHRTDLYQEFFRPLDVEHQLVAAVPASFGVVALSLGRPRVTRNFSERERRIFDVLQPHLVQAYQNVCALARGRAELKAAEDALAGSSDGLIVVDGDARVRLMSRPAARLLGAYFGWKGRARPLPTPLAEFIGAIRNELEGRQAGPPVEKMLHVERPGRSLLVRAVVERSNPPDAPVALQLHLEECGVNEAQEPLRALGLSAREAEVLKWVARGRSNYGIAVILGLSERTVEKHLERIFAKLGVWNRTEAAARALACFSSQLLHD